MTKLSEGEIMAKATRCKSSIPHNGPAKGKSPSAFHDDPEHVVWIWGIFACAMIIGFGLVGYRGCQSLYEAGRKSMALEIRQIFIDNKGKLAKPFVVPHTGVHITTMDKSLYWIEEDKP